MKTVEEFKIEHWRSYASALSLNDLIGLSTDSSLSMLDPDVKLTYGSFEGSEKLRASIAALHSSEDNKVTADNVIITPGSIMANFLVLDTICGEGDHIICQYPTFGQLYSVPKFSGVDVTMWKMDDKNGWMPNIEELSGMIKPNTKAIVINNPNNPTGAVLSKDFLLKIIEIAQQSNILVFCDEVFSPLFHTDVRPPSIVSLGYANTVATGALSKAFALPGIRVGWIITENAELASTIKMKRVLTTTSVSQLSDSVASFALDKAVMPHIMERNLALCGEGLRLLEDFVKRNEGRVRWVKPQGSGTAFVQVLDREGKPVDDVVFSKELAEKESICVIPGGLCFGENAGDFKGYLRITLGDPDAVRKGLPALERFIQDMA
ncbi:hypothetical protein ACHAQA_003497 [Verticillium albo-atrum]